MAQKCTEAGLRLLGSTQPATCFLFLLVDADLRSDFVALSNEALNGILISLLMKRIDAIAP